VTEPRVQQPPPAVSVVVPTYNRRERLARVLVGFAAQRDDALFEVVVVSDGSTDGTDEYLRSGQTPIPVTSVFQSNAGPAEARNQGIAAARGDLVLFVDDDVVPEPGLVLAHVRAHARNGGDIVVIGPMLTPPGFTMTPWVRWEQSMLEKQYALLAGLPTAHYRNFYTGNASIARARLDEVGGFDPKYRRAEDVELAYRLSQCGLGFVFDPAARALHFAERSFGSWLDNAYEYGRNDVRFVREGQHEILGEIVNNYRNRHMLQRAVVRFVVPRPRVAKIAAPVLHRCASIAELLHLRAFNRQALSGLYGLRYHLGVADEVGGANLFLRLLRADPRAAREVISPGAVS
jgi:glycosyltransferase involved in cell wall biosynthesis